MCGFPFLFAASEPDRIRFVENIMLIWPISIPKRKRNPAPSAAERAAGRIESIRKIRYNS